MDKKTKLAKRGEPELKSSRKSWNCILRKLKETKNWTQKSKERDACEATFEL